MKKTMKELQTEADHYISQFKTGYFSPANQMLRLTEEVGELAREINHYFGPKKKKETEKTKELQEEMGDVLFVLIALANSLDIQLDAAFEDVLEKYRERDYDRFERVNERSAKNE